MYKVATLQWHVDSAFKNSFSCYAAGHNGFIYAIIPKGYQYLVNSVLFNSIEDAKEFCQQHFEEQIASLYLVKVG